MPVDNNEKLKQRDFKTLKRIEAIQNSSRVLRSFFEKGFKSFDALKAIVLHYHPELPEARLWDYWHFRINDEDITEMLDQVFDKLNAG